MDELGELLERVLHVLPAGIVVYGMIRGIFFRFERRKGAVALLEIWFSLGFTIRSIGNTMSGAVGAIDPIDLFFPAPESGRELAKHSEAMSSSRPTEYYGV